ncbi:glycerate kinase [Prolixibacteraceae bacterium JC049]|nr:glycerate kinase [Prolixibacteraceae bacterium JC049]
MNVLIAPNSMKGSLSAAEFAKAIQYGLANSEYDFQYRLMPVADGGDGTAVVLAKALGASKQLVPAHDPLMREIEVPIYITHDKQVIFEMADVAGMKLLSANELNPMVTTTYGVGEVIRYCLEKGYKKILLGVGGSATVDGGLGLLAALGGKVFDNSGNELKPIASNLHNIAKLKLAQLGSIKIEVLCDVDNPLTGINGAANIFAPQKGASDADVAKLEKGLTNWGDLFNANLKTTPMMGAAGGIAVALKSCFDAELVPGAETVLKRIGFHEALEKADVVITGEGQIDEQTECMKAPSVVAEACRITGKKIYALAGSVKDNCNFDAAFAVWDGKIPLSEAMANAEQLVQQKAKSIAKVIFEGV